SIETETDELDESLVEGVEGDGEEVLEFARSVSREEEYADDEEDEEEDDDDDDDVPDAAKSNPEGLKTKLADLARALNAPSRGGSEAPAARPKQTTESAR
ncbi:hypothetical protein LTR66_014370, partial [Elasticomyces elasticus]